MTTTNLVLTPEDAVIIFGAALQHPALHDENQVLNHDAGLAWLDPPRLIRACAVVSMTEEDDYIRREWLSSAVSYAETQDDRDFRIMKTRTYFRDE